MHRLSILLLVAAVTLSLTLPTFAMEDSNEELELASQYLSSRGIMVGDGEGNMNFDGPLTRAHLATILSRIHGEHELVENNQEFYVAQCKFLDVPDWAKQYVGYCSYHGLMVGYGGNLFGAEDYVTPAAACTVILRYLALPEIEWDYTNACNTACDLGLSSPAVSQKVAISRGDLALMLYRALTWSNSHEPDDSTEESVSISSYKGTTLEVGARSGLIVSPAEEVNELVSSNPDVIAVEQVSGNWVAVAKSPGFARIFAVTADGERGNLVMIVPADTGGLTESETGTDYSDNLEIREEILALVNQVRQEYGLSVAPADQSLMEAAQDYATRRNTWHDSQEECELVLAHGYPHGFNCNLTVFTGVPLEEVARTAVDNWCNSPGHLQAMIDPKADIYQCLLQGDTEEAARYCEDLRTPVREISQTVWTGDKALDYLISSKLALAEQEHIKTKVNIEYPHNTNIRSVDLTTILGNLLDNALEAAQAAPDGLRFLNLTIRRINAMLIIKVENGYGHDLKREDGKLLTTKSDRAFHGWGLKSVQTAADRYDGTISTDDKDGIFQSVVTLSFQAIKTK